ncbi:MAG: LysR family transcriptional regulator substrate-binding protein, partial [Solirubrobacterales bacterium]|nr:LysR family transcriptional regulator substrate-binding protein [Solirubrobacterales bacterium]
QIKLESNESERIKRLVARDMGVAILPRSDADRPGTEVAVANLIEPALRRDITLACREGRRLAPAASEFLELSKELFTDASA